MKCIWSLWAHREIKFKNITDDSSKSPESSVLSVAGGRLFSGFSTSDCDNTATCQLFWAVFHIRGTTHSHSSNIFLSIMHFSLAISISPAAAALHCKGFLECSKTINDAATGNKLRALINSWKSTLIAVIFSLKTLQMGTESRPYPNWSEVWN